MARGKVVQKRRFDLALKVFVDYEEFYIDGVKVTPEAFLAAFPERPLEETSLFVGGKPPQFKELHCEALAYHVKQRKEAEAHFEKLGIGDTRIDSMGRPVIRSREHYKRVQKALQVHPNNSYSEFG